MPYWAIESSVMIPTAIARRSGIRETYRFRIEPPLAGPQCPAPQGIRGAMSKYVFFSRRSHEGPDDSIPNLTELRHEVPDDDQTFRVLPLHADSPGTHGRDGPVHRGELRARRAQGHRRAQGNVGRLQGAVERRQAGHDRRALY